MPKINKKTLVTFPRIPSLKIYQFTNTTNYFCNFYVGTHILKSGNKEITLKTKNVNEAKKRAKEEYYYRSIFEEHFPSNTAALTVPSVPSIACSSPTALAWDASFQNVNEPSGRAIKTVHDDSY